MSSLQTAIQNQDLPTIDAFLETLDLEDIFYQVVKVGTPDFLFLLLQEYQPHPDLLTLAGQTARELPDPDLAVSMKTVLDNYILDYYAEDDGVVAPPTFRVPALSEQEEFVATLSKAETELLKLYTYQGDKGLNYSQKNQQIDRLNDLFARVPPLTNDLILYRGVDADRGSVDRRLNYIYGNFLSTSVSSQVAKAFKGLHCCLYTIKVFAGTKVLPLYPVSRFANEQEVLLQGRTYYDNYYSDDDNIAIVYLPTNIMTPVKIGHQLALEEMTYLVVDPHYHLDKKSLIGVNVIFFAPTYNKVLPPRVIPPSVTKLIFGSDYRQPIGKDVIPPTVQYIKFGADYNQPLDHIPASTDVVLGEKEQLLRVHNEPSFAYYLEQAIVNGDEDALTDLMASRYFTLPEAIDQILINGNLHLLNVLQTKYPTAKNTALLTAVQMDEAYLVRQLLEDPEVDVQYLNGEALRVARQFGRANIEKLVLKKY